MVSSEAIAAMKNMALIPEKRAILVKDATCIGGLILVLSNQDPCIVQQALQTLILLTENHTARKVLRSQLGLIDQLDSITQRQQLEDSTKQLAKQLKHTLTDVSDAFQTPLRDTSNLSRNGHRNEIRKSHSKAKSIVLQIRGMNDRSDRELCSRLLLRVSGVISITFDMNKKHCILRVKPDVKAEDLAASISKSMTMIAQQVIRNERGEESLVNFNLSGHSDACSAKEEDLPDYLSDDSDHSFVDEMALRKPSEEDKKKSAGWFSKAANFISNSFYW